MGAGAIIENVNAFKFVLESLPDDNAGHERGR
jgi:hypothetical protein